MKIGTQLGFEGGFDCEKEDVFQRIADIGFQSVDYPLCEPYSDAVWQLTDQELRIKMEEILTQIKAAGMIVGQTHAPMDAYWRNDAESKEARWKAQVQAIKATSYLESPYIVIHPLMIERISSPSAYQEAKELNMEFYRFLEPYLKEYDVKAAIENVYAYNATSGLHCKSICSTAEELKDYVDTLNSDRFVVCLDIGHAFMCHEDPSRMIYELGKKYLKVLHLHDNDTLLDDHEMPGAGKIDWVSVGKALNEIRFEGVFNYEAAGSFGRINKYAKELMPELLCVYAEFGKALLNQTK